MKKFFFSVVALGAIILTVHYFQKYDIKIFNDNVEVEDIKSVEEVEIDLPQVSVDIEIIEQDEYYMYDDFDTFIIYKFPYNFYKIYFGGYEAEIESISKNGIYFTFRGLNNLPKNELTDITIDIYNGHDIVKRLVIDDIIFSTKLKYKNFNNDDNLKTAKTIYANHYNGDLDVFSEYQYLQNLFLASSDVDIDTLPELEKLQRLDISPSATSGDISSLERLSNLKEIRIAACAVSGDIEVLSKLPNLIDVTISGCPFITGDISALAVLENLLYIRMQDNSKITGQIDSLKPLEDLVILNLQRCPEIGGDLSSLSNMKDLEFVLLSGCQNVTGSVSDLDGLNKIYDISVSDCPLVSP